MAVNMLLHSAAGGGAIPLSATVSPDITYGFSSYGTIISAEPGICSPAGGVPPYTYLWTYVSGSASIHIQNATNPSTYFTVGGKAFFDDFAVFKCVVTDSSATVVNSSNNITVYMTRDPGL